jgi:hypothetical protein
MTMETQLDRPPSRQRWLAYARMAGYLFLITPALVLAGIPGRLELITRFAGALLMLGMDAEATACCLSSLISYSSSGITPLPGDLSARKDGWLLISLAMVVVAL